MAARRGVGKQRKPGTDNAGQVRINGPRVSVGRIGEHLLLLHVPTDRFVTVYAYGERIWKKIEAGKTDIATLVKEHAAENSVTPEVAAFEVIAFLDELRAEGFVTFTLPRERESAPLLDMPLGVHDLKLPQLLPYLTGQPGPGEDDGTAMVAYAIDDPAPTLTLRELAVLTESRPSRRRPPQRRVTVIHQAAASTTLQQLERLPEVNPSGRAVATRRLLRLRAPAPDLTLGELEALAHLRADPGEARRGTYVALDSSPSPDSTVGEDGKVARRAKRRSDRIVIVIKIGPIVIVIVIEGGDGASSGKSRSSCKTMCV